MDADRERIDHAAMPDASSRLDANRDDGEQRATAAFEQD